MMRIGIVLFALTAGVSVSYAQAPKGRRADKRPAPAAAAAPAPQAAVTTPAAGAIKSTLRIPPPLTFDKLTYSDGLPNSHVKAIVQDRLGFIWFGTQDGLARYDGARMRVYKHLEDDPTTISAAYITALALDADGKLWAGSAENGINLYDPVTDRFTRFEADGKDGSPSSAGITAIVRDRKDRMWFAMSGGGLNRFDAATSTFAAYTDKPLDTPIMSLAADDTGNLWLGTVTEGLIRWNPDDGSAESFRSGEVTGAPTASITAVLAASDGTIWLGTEGEGLAEFDPKARKFKLHRQVADDPGTISSDNITALFEDKDKNIWIGTASGLNRLAPSGTITQYHHDPHDPLSLAFPGIESIFQDAAGVMWVGGLNVGACKFDLSREHFGRNRTRTHPTNSFFEDRDGTLWVGTYQGGLYRYDWKSQRMTLYQSLGPPNTPGSISFETVWIAAIHRDKKKTLWLALKGQGLVGFDPVTESYRQYLPDPDRDSSLPVETVWDIWEDERGGLWLASWGGGLVRFDPAKESFDTYTTEDGIGLTSNHLYTIYPDPTDAKILWLGTAEGGLVRFDRGTQTAKAFRHDPKNPATLGSDDVLSIHRDAAGVVWVGTYGGGLNRLEPDSGKVRRFTTSNSQLTNNVVFGVLPDDEGHLWLSTNGGGLLRFDAETSTFLAYRTPDGLQGSEFAQGAFMRNASGKLYFGGVDGFNAFNPKEITRDTYAPPVVLTGLTMFNQEAQLDRPVWTMKQLEVSYSDSFEVQFAALSFAAPQYTRYAYKLEGFDKDFIETDRPYATYTQLDGGKYTLRVRAMNRHGVWNESGVTLALAVTPPIWRTWPAYIAYLLVMIGGVFLVFYIQRQRLRRIQRESRLAVVERDLALTGAVQTGFLPEYNEIRSGRVEVFGFYRGADACSGDWWWHEKIGAKHIVLVGDVTGHGPGPAMVTAAVASTFRVLVESGLGDLQDVLLVLNRTVLQVSKGNYNMTMAALELDELTGHWMLYSAGAPPIMTLGADAKHKVLFCAGTPLGTATGFEAGFLQGHMQPSERILMYTDGIPEIMMPNGSPLGMRRFAQIYERTRDNDLRDAASSIVQQADLIQAGKPQDDDWTFAIIEWDGREARQDRERAA